MLKLILQLQQFHHNRQIQKLYNTNMKFTYSSDVIISVSYYLLTLELLLLTFWKSQLIKVIVLERNETKRLLVIMVVGIVIMFASFIFLCGVTHSIRAAEYYYISSPTFHAVKSAAMIWCAIISCITAIAGLSVFPFISKVLDMYELTEEGIVKLANDVDSYKDSFMVLDSNFTVVRGNLSSRTLFGPNYIRSSMLEFVWDQEDIIKLRTSLESLVSAKNDDSISIEFKAYGDAHHDEDYRWLESTLQKKLVKGSKGDDFEIIVTTRNINDQKKAEMYRSMLLEHQGQEQQRINEAKMLYVTCVAHDLKTPLQSFSFAMNLLSKSNLTDEQLEIVNNAQVSVDLMMLTVSQAMHISKVQTGVAVVPRKTSVSMLNLFQRVKVVMKGYGSPVPIIYDMSDTLVDYIITDEEWIWQMMLNLLTNACKYTAEGFIKMTLEVVDGGSMFLCTVSDTGIGIDESKFSSLFKAFNQAQIGQMEGTGLGLYGLRSRAEALGGTCGIRNNLEYGRGCSVWFKIPYIRDSNADLAYDTFVSASHHFVQQPTCTNTSSDNDSCIIKVSPLASHVPELQNELSPNCNLIRPTSDGIINVTVPNSSSTGTSPSIAPSIMSNNSPEVCDIKQLHLTAIVIDDVLPIRKLMSRVLLNLGFSSVDCYENGLTGLKAIKEKEVDVVFSDIQMPILTGPEMVSRFRVFEESALSSGIRTRRQIIIAITANRSGDMGSDNSDFDLVCSKPIDVQQIQHIIQTFCRKGPDNV